MKKFFLFNLCLILLLSVGCGNQTESVLLENDDSESTEYILRDFNKDDLQEIENHGITLLIPKTWKISIDEENNDKSIRIIFDYGRDEQNELI